MMTIPSYEVYAIRYAKLDRRASENFIGGDPHDGPMPLDYFVWVVTGHGRTFAVDTGFSEAHARKRSRVLLRSPLDGLRMAGFDPTQIEDVIVTHMHYDHAGNIDRFPRARFHVQDSEMAYCTGRCMCHPMLRFPFDADDVGSMVRHVFAGRVQFHDGDEEIAPGLSLHRIGGHSMGLQSVRVMTRRGWVVLASDATHFYAHFEQGRVFPIVHDIAGVLEGYRKLAQLASSNSHVIPGHDPEVMKRYPAARPDLAGVVARLDADPNE
jgi:glyoxylase-like metal-dependent hydrolase (beta-lactamase superfamily II)